VPSVRVIDFDEAYSRCPVLVRERHAPVAVLEPDAMDIDVAALHQAYVQGLRARAGTIHRNAPVVAIERGDNGWRVRTPSGEFDTALVVNAAGAWCDEIAAHAGLPRIGLQPLRRTAFTCAAPDDVDVRSWPLVADVDDRYYFKPEGPQLLCSLADETPSPPCDARPEEVDVALAIERINAATTLELRHVRRAWAGLRTFAPDRSLVIGIDPDAPGFCWLAGQGGYGIQTAPAAARAAVGLVTEGRLPADLLALGVTADQLSPARFR
jgi:D-arginine dehydrogenase